ncbi:DUF935 domain-containing protein [Thaumasiovibrio subtropicus]|uniref:DUF935 domain-containing protein n=1 Tax=Thaumasiovibrio subtropicus TaxID=1891207 RepID=UPI000B35DF87|nr:DUF935 domain-containing protein [Thaumasiovibrio subtropicus]
MIIDIYGRKLTAEHLDEPQTDQDSKLAHLQRHYANHPSNGLTPRKLAALMQRAEHHDLIAQCELAEDMEEKDAHLQSELSKRKMALLGQDWRIIPPRNATAAEENDADMIQELLEDATWLDDALFDMSDAILKGFANLELEWRFEQKTHLVHNYHFREAAWFTINPEHRNELRLRDDTHQGEPLRPFGWISHIGKAKSGYLSRAGLIRVLAWPYLFKNYSVRDLAEFLEIYGLPLRIGKYADGATEREKHTLLRAVMSIGHNAGGIIPKGMEIEFEKAAEGASEPFMAMIAWCEKSISKAILGGTLTSQADGKTSTNALGNVHNEVREEIRNFDLKRLAATLTRDLIYPLYALNGKSFKGPHRHPRFEFDLTEAEDIEHLSKSLPNLVKLGMQIPVSWVHEKTQIPQATDGEATLGLTPIAEPKPTDNTAQHQASLSANTIVPTAPTDRNDTDIPAQQTETLRQEAGGLLELMIDEVRELVESATSLTQLREDILGLQGQISTEQLGETLALAMAAAELSGISDVTEGH